MESLKYMHWEGAVGEIMEKWGQDGGVRNWDQTCVSVSTAKSAHAFSLITSVSSNCALENENKILIINHKIQTCLACSQVWWAWALWALLCRAHQPGWLRRLWLSTPVLLLTEICPFFVFLGLFLLRCHIVPTVTHSSLFPRWSSEHITVPNHMLLVPSPFLALLTL